MNKIGVAVAIAIVSFTAVLAAADALPTEAEMKAAVDRGHALREQKALVNEVLGKNAFVIKIGDVRCGHGLTTLEDAKGENGATYRLIEESRSAMADDEGGVIVDYKGTYLLNNNLGLISGTLAWKNSVMSTADKSQQVHDEKCEFKVEKNELKWNSTVGGKDMKDSVTLNGDAPIPQSILSVLALFAEKNPAIFDKPVCVPELSPLNEQQTFDIQPAWITFEHPKDKPKSLKANIVHLLGDFDKQGMSLSPNSRWSAPQVFVMEGSTLTQLPAAPAPGFSIEPIAPDKLAPDTALDLKKIATAISGMAPQKP